MLCSYKDTIYPRNGQTSDNGYTVAVYKPHEKILLPNGFSLDEVKAVGYMLPTAKGVQFDLQGSWEDKKPHGYQFTVTGYNEVVQHTKNGIIAYLSSGLIRGIGPKIAERIYEEFGDNTLEILDTDPDKLLKISGISEKKLERIKESYLEYRGARDIVAFLSPFGITPARSVKIFEAFGPNALGIVKEHPYRLCEMQGIGFATADKLAQKMGLDPQSMERIEAGIMHTLRDNESKNGHLCLSKAELHESSREILNINGATIPSQNIGLGISNLVDRNWVVNYKGSYYRWMAERAEREIAKKVYELLAFGEIPYAVDLDAEIIREEKALGIVLEQEQRMAVKTCLTNPLCVVTGGPGTGKTTIQHITLRILKRCTAKADIVCCAPTGRAASKLNESTGEPASTIHRALGLMAEDVSADPEPLDADTVLVDELSMLDVFLARQLFNAIPYGCQLILVGDIDQLESVGPGAVLRELINSGAIPVVRLEKVFRQGRDNVIPINACLIKNGLTALETDKEQFDIIRSMTFDESAERLKELYLAEVQRVGLKNVILLSPFRYRTATGVDILNPELRDLVNPAANGKSEIAFGDKVFREGDRVMQLKNNYSMPWEDDENDCNGEGVYNGDIGQITRIAGQRIMIKFDDGKRAGYDRSDLEQIDWAYANTVHKSQGCEYRVVLLNLQTGHRKMLRKNMVYTGITRAREKVVIVGEQAALYMAIKNGEIQKRNTHLADRIAELVPAQLKATV